MRGYWNRAGTPQKVVLGTVFVLGLLINMIEGWGLIIGGAGALFSTLVVALIWSGVAFVWSRMFKRKEAVT